MELAGPGVLIAPHRPWPRTWRQAHGRSRGQQYHIVAAGMSDQGDDFTAAYLRACYSKRENTVYIWMAIDWCLNEYPPHPLPNWCMAYLAKVAREFNAMMETGQSQVVDGVQVTFIGLIGKRQAQPPPRASAILHVLGFTAKGKSAFKDARTKQRSIHAAIRFDLMRKRGRSYGEALSDLMDWLGEIDDSNAKKILITGRRLLRAASKPSGKTSGQV
jgi:hypothetical protein